MDDGCTAVRVIPCVCAGVTMCVTMVYVALNHNGNKGAADDILLIISRGFAAQTQHTR
jgi:hypothetical protein